MASRGGEEQAPANEPSAVITAHSRTGQRRASKFVLKYLSILLGSRGGRTAANVRSLD